MRTIAGGVLAAGAAAALAGCTSSGEGPSSPGVTQPTASGGATQQGGAGQSGTAQAGGGSSTATGASAAGGGATTQGAQGAQGSGGGTAACATGSVSVKLTAPDAGLGHRSYVLVFTNTGSSTCTLTGYAGAAVTDGSGAVLLNAQRTLAGYEGGAPGVSTVSLAPGGNASAVLEWDAAPANGADPVAANCPGMAGGYLEITPPNTTASTKVPAPSDLCTDFQIHPVIAGTAGRAAN